MSIAHDDPQNCARAAEYGRIPVRLAAASNRRSGRGELGALLLVALAVAGGLFFALGRSGAGEEVGEGRVPANGSTAGPGAHALEHAEGPGSAALEAVGRIETGLDLEYKDRGKVFEGMGMITGVIDAAQGVEFPASWELVIEPSRFGVGSKHAITRIVPIDGAQRTFEERDLPMAGYRVYARAPGLNCPAEEVLLFKVEGYEQLPGKDHVHLMLRFYKAGFVDGSVRDEAGSPVEALPVFLEDVFTKSRETTETRPDGTWRFDAVRDGRYKLYFGDPNRPLIPAEEIVCMAPSLRVEERVVPVTWAVRFEVRDETGTPLADAIIRGYGSKGGGAIQAKSDLEGIAIQRFLPVGQYNVTANHPNGLRGKRDFLITGDEREKLVEINCKP